MTSHLQRILTMIQHIPWTFFKSSSPSSPFTWHEAIALAQQLTALRLQGGDDDGARVHVVVVVQHGALAVVAVVVVVGQPGLHGVWAVVAGAVRIGRVVHRHAADHVLPVLRR